MKIIILGAGQVGGSLAEILVNEKHDVTLVDSNGERLRDLSERFDLRVVEGRCSYPDVLRQAGADDADMIIAVTDNDEANMVACQVAYSLFRISKKIARIRSPHYFTREELFSTENFPIDFFISPEQLVTDNVQQLIKYPGALQVLSFSHESLKLVVVKAYYGGFLVGKSLEKFSEYLPDIRVKVAGIFRNERFIALEESTEIEIGDEVFFVAAGHDIDIMMAALRRTEDPYRRVMIAGGGNIGGRLAQVLQEDYSVKLIEHNKERCQQLAERLDKVTVLSGEVSDAELLIDENIENMDVFCAVTNSDEANIIACIQAKRLGVKQVMALITRMAYVNLIDGSPINTAISPQQVTVGPILAQVRRGDIVNVHCLRRGDAEAIEAIVTGDRDISKIVGRILNEISLPEQIEIVAIIRGDDVIIPNASTMIESGDHIVLFITDKRRIRDLERLFEGSRVISEGK